MLDVGCGPGGQVLTALDLGLDAQGIDGDYTVDRPGNHWCIHDYTVGPSPVQETFDLVWSCEFVEHVYEDYMPNYLADFARGTWICMTYAPPGFPGHHHVNCQPTVYWEQHLAERGFYPSPADTAEIQRLAKDSKHIRETGMLFIRR